MPVIELQTYIDYIGGERPSVSDATLVNYKNAIEYTGVKTVDTENLDGLFKDLLAKLENKMPYGYIQNILKIIRSTLRLHGVTWTKGYNYNVLEKNLSRCGSTPKGYREEEVKQMFLALQGDSDLVRAMILCVYSGLRIGGVEGLKFSDFKRFDPGVYVYPVFSKQVHYLAAISEYAFLWLKKLNYPETPFVVPFDSTVRKSDLGKLYRKKMIDALVKHGLGIFLEDKQPFHGFRKFYADTINASALLPDEISWLMGHIPKTTAFKIYINNMETGGPRIAEIYSRTSLMNLRVI